MLFEARSVRSRGGWRVLVPAAKPLFFATDTTSRHVIGGRGRVAPVYEIFCSRGFCLQMCSTGAFRGQSAVMIAAFIRSSVLCRANSPPNVARPKSTGSATPRPASPGQTAQSLPAGPVPATSCHPSQMRCQFRPCLYCDGPELYAATQKQQLTVLDRLFKVSTPNFLYREHSAPTRAQTVL